MSEPESDGAPNKNLEKLEPFERWKEEVSAKVKEYEEVVDLVRQKLEPMVKRLQDLEASFSQVVEESSTENILARYEKLLRMPLITGVVVREKALRPKTEYRRLRGALAQLQERKEASTEQHEAGVALLSKLEEVALDLEDEMVGYEQNYRYLGSIWSTIFDRTRAIREKEAEKQLRALNESLRKTTERVLLYTAIIAFFAVLNFVAVILRW